MAYIPPSYQPSNYPKYPLKKNNKVTVGIIIILVGLAFLLKNILPFFPGWIFSWPMFLIVLGIFIGSRYDFKGNSWWIVTGLGIIFLIDKILFSMVFLKPFIFPIILIIIGVLMVIRSRNRQAKLINTYGHGGQPVEPQVVTNPDMITQAPLVSFDHLGDTSTTDTAEASTDTHADSTNTHNAHYGSNQQHEYSKYNYGYQDFIQVNSFFGGNTLRVLSKTFKGGSVTCMFGGAEVDLTQADFEGLVFIDIFCAFGGTEIFVPGDWNIINEVTSILGGVEDRRRFAAGTNSKKTLVIKGTVMFGGIEIKNG